MVTGLLFGTAPAFQAGRTDLAGSMKGSSRAVTVGSLRRRLRDGLVVIEIGLACMLLVGSALLMRSFMRMQQVEVAGSRHAAHRRARRRRLEVRPSPTQRGCSTGG